MPRAPSAAPRSPGQRAASSERCSCITHPKTGARCPQAPGCPPGCPSTTWEEITGGQDGHTAATRRRHHVSALQHPRGFAPPAPSPPRKRAGLGLPVPPAGSHSARAAPTPKSPEPSPGSSSEGRLRGRGCAWGRAAWRRSLAGSGTSGHLGAGGGCTNKRLPDFTMTSCCSRLPLSKRATRRRAAAGERQPWGGSPLLPCPPGLEGVPGVAAPKTSERRASEAGRGPRTASPASRSR